MNRTTLLATIAAGRARLETALAGLPDGAMADRIDEAWTRTDVLAHLEAWERRVVEDLATLRCGDAPDRSVDTDALNEAWYRAGRERPLADVRAGEAAAYQAVIATIEGASDEELFDGSHFAWTEGDPFAGWLRGNTDEHYDEHLAQLGRPAR